MVYHVIITMVNTTCIRCGQHIFQKLVIVIRTFDNIPEILAELPIFQIFVCGIHAALIMDAVLTALCRTFWGILRSEPGQRSKGRDLRTPFPIQEIVQNVRIMAAFCNDHRSRFIAAAPISAHIAVGIMPESNVFDMMDGLDFPNLTLIDHLFYSPKERRMPQNMAHHQ